MILLTAVVPDIYERDSADPDCPALSNPIERPALLFLCQRLPYPPNKGEKIAAFNIVRHLANRFDVHVATLIDTTEEALHIGEFRSHCAGLHVEEVGKPQRWVLAGFRWLAGMPVSFALYRSAGLKTHIKHVLEERRPVAIVAYSSNISDYAFIAGSEAACRVLHFSDVDSEKFAAYAKQAHGWRRWLFLLEARRVRASEARLARRADAVGFVSDDEVALFRKVVGSDAARIVTIANGVDAESFDPNKPWPRPNWGKGPAFVFTGSMDYPPNVDAVIWFAEAILPSVRAAHRDVQFAIVGANPAPAVKALSQRPGVLVTGRVHEVQPYLAHAAAAVAPLRIARGIQNKVLEALSMGRPTIVSPYALTGIGAPETTPVIVADSAEEWIKACIGVLEDPAAATTLGERARPFVRGRFSWAARLETLDSLLCSLIHERKKSAHAKEQYARIQSHKALRR